MLTELSCARATRIHVGGHGNADVRHWRWTVPGSNNHHDGHGSQIFQRVVTSEQGASFLQQHRHLVRCSSDSQANTWAKVRLTFALLIIAAMAYSVWSTNVATQFSDGRGVDCSVPARHPTHLRGNIVDCRFESREQRRGPARNLRRETLCRQEAGRQGVVSDGVQQLEVETAPDSVEDTRPRDVWVN